MIGMVPHKRSVTIEMMTGGRTARACPTHEWAAAVSLLLA